MLPFVTEAMAQGLGGDAASNSLIQFVPLILIFIVFYFLLIRPHQKKQKLHQQMLSSLKKGDRVVTMSGIHGVILRIEDEVIHLEIADRVKIQMDRSQIGRLLTNPNKKDEEKKTDSK